MNELYYAIGYLAIAWIIAKILVIARVSTKENAMTMGLFWIITVPTILTLALIVGILSSIDWIGRKLL